MSPKRVCWSFGFYGSIIAELGAEVYAALRPSLPSSLLCLGFLSASLSGYGLPGSPAAELVGMSAVGVPEVLPFDDRCIRVTSEARDAGDFAEGNVVGGFREMGGREVTCSVRNAR